MNCENCGTNIDEAGVLTQWGHVLKRVLCKPCYQGICSGLKDTLMLSWGADPEEKNCLNCQSSYLSTEKILYCALCVTPERAPINDPTTGCNSFHRKQRGGG